MVNHVVRLSLEEYEALKKRIEALEAELRQWRILINQDPDRPFRTPTDSNFLQ